MKRSRERMRNLSHKKLFYCFASCKNIHITCSLLWRWLSLWIFIIFNFDSLSHILSSPFKVWMCLLVEHSLIVTRCNSTSSFATADDYDHQQLVIPMPARCIHVHLCDVPQSKTELIHCIPEKLRIVRLPINFPWKIPLTSINFNFNCSCCWLPTTFWWLLRVRKPDNNEKRALNFSLLHKSFSWVLVQCMEKNACRRNAHLVAANGGGLKHQI